MTIVQNDPDANPTYGESKAINEEITGPGTGGSGTDVTDPGAVVLSQGLADQIAVDPGTVVPNGTKITPSTTPNSGGVTTIEYPATPNSVASKVTVVPYTRDSNGNITNADKAGIVMPTVVPVGFTASDNPVSDVQSLLDNHATLQQIQAYMALNNVSWGQLSGPQQSTLGKMGYSTSNTGDSYEFDSPDKNIGTVYVPVKEWDSWTPAEQLAFQIKLKLTPSDARLVINKDGSWGYTSKSAAATNQASSSNSGMTNGIPTDLYNTYLANKDRYAAAGKPPPLNFDHTIDGQVTVTPYADPSKAVTYTVATGTQLFFNNVKGMPGIDRVTDLKGNTIIKANSDGTFNTNDVYTAFKNGTLSKTAAISLIGGTAFNQSQINAGIMAILNNPKNGLTDGKGNYDIAKALSQKNVTQADLLEAGFTQDEINDALKPPKAAANSSNTPSFPASYSQDDWDKDIASGKIPKGATFISYDSKTGIVNYNVPSTATVPDAIYTEINKSLTDPKQTMSGQISALNDAIENAGYWNNTLLGKTVYLGGQTFYVDAKGNILTQQDQVKIQWNNLTDTQKQTVAGLYSQDLYRTNPFSETTKQIAVAGQKGGIIGELATSPLTGITIPIAKAASGQHVTAQDIEGAVVTVVGDALMVGGGDAVVSGFGNAGKVIVNSLVTGMGTLGMVDTILQIKKGGTPGATIAVEAALSTAALIAGAGGLVSQLVPKDTPDIDVAQQFIDKMNTQTTPEGLAKNSPFQAPSNLSGDAEWGTAEGPTATPDEITKQVADVNSMQSQVKTLQGLLNDTGKSGDTIKVSDIQDKLDVATKQLDDAYNKLAKMQGTAGKPTATAGEITKQVADVNSMQSEVKTLQGILNDAGKSGDTVKVSDIQDKLDVATGQLDDADSELAGMRMGETAYRQAELTATYKEWVEASTKYAQNQYNINDLTAKIADNRATLDAITKGTTIPDEYLAKLASDTGSMEKTLAACQDADAGLAKQVNDTADRFKTTIQSYGSFAKGKGLVFDDSGAGEMLKNLPHNAADVIKSHIDLLMNGDNNPSAIATQEAKVNALQESA